MISIDIDEYSYTPKVKILENLHLNLLPGTISTLLGPSGCGKSTLLRVLMGFEKNAPNFHHSFSLVPQTPYLFPWKTIAENIILGMNDEQRQMQQKAIETRISQMLNIVGLSGIEKKYPFEISVGMSQRVSFARAMINPFHTLLLDEPFSSLDAITRRALQNWLIKMVQDNNNYALFVTHDIVEAIYLSQNIYILSKNPATVVAHFQKNGDSFVELHTNKVFMLEDRGLLEETIFSLLV